MAFDSILDEPFIHAAYRSFTVEIPNPPDDLTRTYIEYSYSLDNSVYSDWIPLADLDSSTVTFTHNSLGLFNEFAEHRDIPVPPDIFADPTAFAVVNPSFDTSIANWTSDNGTYLVRDTVSFDTSPASLKATPLSATFSSGLNICHGDVSGIFVGGEQYSLDFQYTLIGQLGSGNVSANIILGTASDSSSAIFTSSISALSSVHSPSTGADDASVGTISWTNPGNIQTSNNIYATADFGLAGQISHYLKATNFGFSLPAGTINGIVVEIERSAAGAGGQRDSTLRLVRAGTVESVGDHADTSNYVFYPVSDTTRSYGSSSDLWGAAWTTADINNSGFGVALSATTTGTGAATASVDFMRITVYYTPTSAFRLGTIKWTPHTTTSNPSIIFRPNDSNSIQLSVDSFVLSKPPSSADLNNIYQTYDPSTLAAANTIPIYYRYRYRLVTKSGDSDWSDTGYGGQVRVITGAELETQTISIDTLVPSVASTVLPSNPVDGQLFAYIADDANGIIWLLKFRAGSSSAYQWEYIGGSGLISTVLAQENGNSGPYADISGGTVGPSVTVPLAGDYIIKFGFVGEVGNTAAQRARMAPKIGAATASDNDCVSFATAGNATSAAEGAGNSRTLPIATALAAGTVLKCQYRVDIAGGALVGYGKRWIEITPVRVSG